MKGLKKKKYFRPYGLDLKYELNTYRQVGRDYGNRKTAHKGLLLNFMRWRRKRKNRKEDKYKFCNTFSDWKRHVQKILPTHIRNYEDMIHYLHKQKSEAEDKLEEVKSLLIPMYIAMIALDGVFLGPEKSKSEYNFFYVIVSLLIIVFISVSRLWKAKTEVDFYHDFIEIAEKMKKES